MRAVRVDPISGRPVILASERLARPLTVCADGLPMVSAEDCPFCPGHESDTGRELARRPGEGPWRARAFANRFPALVVEAAGGWEADGPYASHGAVGAHEVIVESPEHDTPLWEQPDAVCAEALRLARDRMRDLSGDARFAAFSWLRNHGLRAGASQAHPHAQVLALPFVPPAVRDQLRMARESLERHGVDVWARLLAHELANPAERLLAAGPELLTLCPWAPSAPFEVWLVPRRARTDFRAAEDGLLAELASAMNRVLRALSVELGREFSYNALLFTAPLKEPAPGFRWHMRILPRTELEGGFERSTGVAVCGLPPEVSAGLLRAALR